MHVSLDSALGRQRRLNSVGESVLQIASSAAAAYSLRSLTGGDPVVVRVRRSSNDAEQDFTSSGVSSGALVNFVNEIQTLGTVTNSSGNNGFTLTNTSSTGFTATTDTATGVCGWPYTAKAGDKITVSFDAVIRSGTPQFLPRRATALSSDNLASVVSDSPLSVNSTASYSFEFTYDDDQAGSLTFSEGDDNADFDISNFQVTVFKGAGLVETWYDQSGNSNDAVQATAGSQPKIVNAGSFLNELDFDGTDDNFELTSVLGMTSAGAIFSVAESGGGNDKLILDNRDSGVDGFRLMRFNNELQYRWQSATAATSTNPGTNTKFIAFANHDGSNASAAVNGATATTTSDTSSISVVAKPHIGARSFSSAANFWDGTINELIIYNSDQNANRSALQTNINSHYSIF